MDELREKVQKEIKHAVDTLTADIGIDVEDCLDRLEGVVDTYIEEALERSQLRNDVIAGVNAAYNYGIRQKVDWLQSPWVEVKLAWEALSLRERRLIT